MDIKKGTKGQVRDPDGRDTAGAGCYARSVDDEHALHDELSALSPAQRAWAEEQLALRARAARVAARLDLDADDVFHMLRHLARTPAERLRLGLLHGRLARTTTDPLD